MNYLNNIVTLLACSVTNKQIQIYIVHYDFVVADIFYNGTPHNPKQMLSGEIASTPAQTNLSNDELFFESASTPDDMHLETRQHSSVNQRAGGTEVERQEARLEKNRRRVADRRSRETKEEKESRREKIAFEAQHVDQHRI